MVGVPEMGPHGMGQLSPGPALVPGALPPPCSSPRGPMPADGAAGCPPDVEAPLWAAFEHASAFASSSRAASMLPPDDATKLALYGLFKRATVGTSEAGRAPGMFDFAGRAKHAAWRNNDRKTKAACMAEYVAMVEALTNGRWRAGDDAEAQTAPT